MLKCHSGSKYFIRLLFAIKRFFAFLIHSYFYNTSDYKQSKTATIGLIENNIKKFVSINAPLSMNAMLIKYSSNETINKLK